MRSLFFVAASCLGIPVAAAAQERDSTPASQQVTTPTPVALPGTEVHRLYSSGVKDTFHLFVSLPPSYRRGEQSYPVVYLLDANILFAGVAPNVGLMQLGRDLPEVVLVGIGYAEGQAGKRSRDYTPTQVASKRECTGARPCGGAAEFLRFVTEELKPFVASRFRVNQTDNTLIGVSRGGLLAAYALFRGPEAFQRYLLVSPELIWDNGVIFEQEKSYAAAGRDLPARVFMAAGALEDETGSLVAHEQNAANLRRFSEQLKKRRYPGLVLDAKIYDGESHFSLPIIAVSQGLRALFR